MYRLVFSVLSSFLVNLFILALAANAQSTIDSGLTTIAEEDQLPDGTGDLLRHEFPGWELKWVAEIDFHSLFCALRNQKKESCLGEDSP
jgi:hypothetical protein